MFNTSTYKIYPIVVKSISFATFGLADPESRFIWAPRLPAERVFSTIVNFSY